MTIAGIWIAYACTAWIFLIGRDQPAEIPTPAPKVHVVQDTTRAP